GGGGDHLAVGALALLRVPLDERGAVEDLPARLRERLALLGGQQDREVADVLDDQVMPSADDLRARLGGRSAPRLLRLVPQLDPPARVLARTRGDLAAPGAGGRIGDVVRRPVGSVDPLAAYQQLVAQERTVSEIEVRDG